MPPLPSIRRPEQNLSFLLYPSTEDLSMILRAACPEGRVIEIGIRINVVDNTRETVSPKKERLSCMRTHSRMLGVQRSLSKILVANLLPLSPPAQTIGLIQLGC